LLVGLGWKNVPLSGDGISCCNIGRFHPFRATVVAIYTRRCPDNHENCRPGNEISIKS
jgi:hypothetical protein